MCEQRAVVLDCRDLSEESLMEDRVLLNVDLSNSGEERGACEHITKGAPRLVAEFAIGSQVEGDPERFHLRILPRGAGLPSR
jgi:hypothetical protein